MTARYKVADLSYCNKGIDFKSLKANGYNAVIIRTGYYGKTDTEFHNHIKAAISNGFHIGVYTYIMSRTPAQAFEEAMQTITLVRKYHNFIDFGIWCDLEDKRVYNGLNKENLSRIIDVFCNCISSHGYYCGVYFNPDFYENRLCKSTIMKRPKWLANWITANGNTNGINPNGKEPRYINKLHCDLWQYGYTVINGKSVDTNLCYTDIPTLHKRTWNEFNNNLNRGFARGN